MTTQIDPQAYGAEVKAAITDAILNGTEVERGGLVDHCIQGNWANAEMRARGLNQALFDEIKAHTLAEIAKYRTTLDKPMDAAAAAACRRLMGSIPYSGMSSLGGVWKFTGYFHGNPPAVSLGDLIVAIEEIRDQIKQAFEAHSAETIAFSSLKTDVAAFRRVLGVAPEVK